MKKLGLLIVTAILASTAPANANWYDNWYCRTISENCDHCCFTNWEICAGNATTPEQQTACGTDYGACGTGCDSQPRCVPGADPGCGSTGSPAKPAIWLRDAG